MNNLLTASRQHSLLRCPRNHYWRYEVGLQHESASLALRLGSAWARAMEARWNGADYEHSLLAAVPPGMDVLDELSVATLSGLLAGYYAHYQIDQQPDTLIHVLHPEVEFRNRLDGSRTFEEAGKMDGLCELHDGRIALYEAKTTSDSVAQESDYWLRLRFNSQLLQYIIAARKFGWNVQCVIYDVVRKPAIEPRQIPISDELGKVVTDRDGKRVFKKDGTPRESGDKEKGYTLQTRTETPEEFGMRLAADTQARPDFYFARREVPIIEADLEEFVEQRLTLSRMILHCRNSQRRFADRPERAWPRNVDERVCGHCEYQSFCLQNLTIDLAHPPAGFKVADPNQELSI